jgi:hypothetical protein
MIRPGGRLTYRGRVLRGGSFENSPENLRSANRDDDDPENRNRNNGFRCVRVASPQHAASAPCNARRDLRSRTPGPPVPVGETRKSGRATSIARTEWNGAACKQDRLAAGPRPHALRPRR